MQKPLAFPSRDFLPYFLTQVLGALNDNVFKNVVTLLLVYGSISQNSALGGPTLANLCGALFILPFALFSGLAGELSERIDKATMIRLTKFAELGIMAVGATGFVNQNLWLLLLTVFLMGTQSTFYGPVKYSFLPERFLKDDLTKANSWVEASTFLAVLTGTILASLLVYFTSNPWVYGSVCLVLSLAGIVASMQIPKVKTNLGRAPFSLSLIKSTKEITKAAKQVDSVYLSILGISSFWGIGSIVVVNLPAIAKGSFGLDETGLSWLLALFSIGVACGSILADKFSGKRLEIGLVPLASVGLAVSLYQLFEASQFMSVEASFLSNPQAAGFGFWLFLAGLFGGCYGVPLYTLVQMRAPEDSAGLVIGFMNFQNALFMAGASILCMIGLAMGLDVQSTLLIAFAMNLITCAIIFTKIPEFAFRLVVLVVARLFYKIDSEQHDIIPENGRCVLVGNHVTWIDSFILSAVCRRPPVYVMMWQLTKVPVLGWFLLNVCKAVPIAGKNENPEVYEKAFEAISKALEDDRLCMIFPEGQLTWDGELAEFKNGLYKILDDTPAPLYGFGMAGAWGTFFSRKNLSIWQKIRHFRLRPPIKVYFEKLDENSRDPELLQNKIGELIGKAEQIR